MTTIRTAVLALLLGAGSFGSALAAGATPAPVVVAQSAHMEQDFDKSERLDPRAVALIAAGIGLVGLVAGIRRRKALGGMPEPV